MEGRFGQHGDNVKRMISKYYKPISLPTSPTPTTTQHHGFDSTSLPTSPTPSSFASASASLAIQMDAISKRLVRQVLVGYEVNILEAKDLSTKTHASLANPYIKVRRFIINI